MNKSYISGGVYLPKDQFPIEDIKKELTVVVFEMGGETGRLVGAYHEEKEGYLCIPRDVGFKYVGIDYEGRASEGTSVDFGIPIRPRNEVQAKFIADLLLKSESNLDFIAKAPCGFGKTVSALAAVQEIGRTTLVLVDQDNLLKQWKDAAKQFLDLKEHEIGIIKGDKCTYRDKKLVIGMMQTLWQRRFINELYDYFGVVVFDECHVVGAPCMSQVLMQFSAAVRFGLSATPSRRDALNKVLEWNLGQVLVRAEVEHKKSSVYYFKSSTVYSWYANISPKVGRIVSEISDDAERNLKIVKAIKFLNAAGRNVLIMGDRIEHLENLMAMCSYEGIKDEDMGLCTGYKTYWDEVKDLFPKKVKHGYNQTKLERLQKRTPKKELEEVKNTKKNIFTTFKMFSKGVDVPRVSAGIDVTPRSQSEQVHGRILRPVPGKLTPIWITIYDDMSYRTAWQFYQRIGEYTESSAEIYEWNEDLGIKLQDSRELRREVLKRSKELKTKTISIGADGRNILVTPATPKPQRPEAGSSTGRRTR